MLTTVETQIVHTDVCLEQLNLSLWTQTKVRQLNDELEDE